MAQTMQVDVVSAEEQIFSGQAEFVVLPGEMGELGVYPRHTPLITRIKPGTVRIRVPGQADEELIFVAGGILEVQPSMVYCIARRFNVDPDQLLALNCLSDGQTVYPGLVLKIPQTGTFPGDRILQRHPTTYTVVSSSETLYSIACKYGDVEPSAIATANGISVGAALTAGQQLSIP